MLRITYHVSMLQDHQPSCDPGECMGENVWWECRLAVSWLNSSACSCQREVLLQQGNEIRWLVPADVVQQLLAA
jgi:hypothetical protein